MSVKGRPYHRKSKWTDPSPGTGVHAIMMAMLSPEGYVRGVADRNGFSTAVAYLRDQCGYDIRIVGKVPGAFAVRAGRFGGKMMRYKRCVYRIVGRAPYNAGEPYQDFLAAELFGDKAA